MTQAEHPEKIGPYRIEERLGQGGMGRVYRAYDERLRRRVALKQIHPERSERPGARQRFLREAQAAARLNHPALVHVHDIIETAEDDWIVMELVEGTPLDRLLSEGRLALSSVLVVALGVAEGLAAAHAAGIMHRDLKTENIMITPNGHPKLLDFGLAKELEVNGGNITLTGDGHLVGTPRAMSPEQAHGHPLDYRTDLFSLGTLLYELVTGLSPFVGLGPTETLAKVCHHKQDPARDHAPDIPPALSDLIDRLLMKEPASRPADTARVSKILQQIAATTDGREVSTSLASSSDNESTPKGSVKTASADRAKPFQFRGERRQLTLLACELTGVSLDPDVLFEALPPFQAIVSETIEHYEGHLRDIQGHRVVACFGYPRSHEDNARRAVLAALQIVARAELVTQGFKARASVHTGSAVILHCEADEHLALGATLDLTLSLQEWAEPGSVLISELAQDLTLGFFEGESVKVGNGVEARRVSAARGIHSRVETGENLTPFVGREHELALLNERFELAREGIGHAVIVTGEAGVGKSRLLAELRNRLIPASPRWISAYGSPYARNLPMHPVAGFLRQLLEIDKNVAANEQLVQLRQNLAEHNFVPEETLPLFATLLGLPVASQLGLSELRSEALEAIPALVQEAAERGSLVVAFEDLHQVDPTTLELIGRIIDEAAATPILLILTCRPAFRPPWEHRTRMTQLRLPSLDGGEIDEFINYLAAEIADEARTRIVDRCDGVPLSIEELCRDTSERSGCASIPEALRDALTVRLDRLGTAREVARVAATLGRQVLHHELAAVCALDEVHLSDDLDQLLDAEVLAKSDATGFVSYHFQRVLIQQAASASLLAEDREQLRQRLSALCES